MLEMGEGERGAGDVADLARAGGDVLQGAPAAGDQREPAFSQAEQERSSALRVRVSISRSDQAGKRGL